MNIQARRARILRILPKTSPDAVTTREIAKRTGLSKSTVRRDLLALENEAHVGVRADGQTALYWATTTPPIAARWGPRDAAGLQAAIAALAPYRLTGIDELFGSLHGKEVDSGLRERKVSAFEYVGPVGDVSPKWDVIEPLLRAIEEHRQCAVQYTPRGEGTARTYRIEPLKLLLYDGVIYLRGRFPKKPGRRLFPAHRIDQVHVLGECFEPPKREAPRTAFRVTEDDPVEVEVWFHAEIAEYIEERRWHPSQKIVKNPDGSLQFTARLSGMYEFVGWVMSWGHRAELRRPGAWRAELRERAVAAVMAHQDGFPPRSQTS